VTLDDGEIMEELDNWQRFADALTADDRAVFREMLGLCYEYFPAIQARSSPFPAEAILMSLLLMQHKTMVWLAAEVERLRGEENARLDT
jgi:hypothetical protein